jgi:hypothetical protein
MGNTLDPHGDANLDSDDDDFDARLAAEGALGVDKSAIPKREIEIIRRGDEKLDDESQWFVAELEVGDLYRRGVAQPITRTGEKLFATPILTRTIIKETDPHARQGAKVVATWSRRPRDADFVKKTGTQSGGLQRSGNKHRLLEISESYWLIDRAIWRLTLFWPDAKLIDTVNELTDLATRRDAKGGLHPCGLSETRWALSTVVDDDRWVDLRINLAVYHESSGPSRDEVALARERYNELLRTLPQYPDPDAIRYPASDDGDTVATPPDRAPPVRTMSDYDGDLPEWMRG